MEPGGPGDTSAIIARWKWESSWGVSLVALQHYSPIISGGQNGLKNIQGKFAIRFRQTALGEKII
jgi:hypothetical protein